MKILIIGASGYIGRYLAEHLLEKNHQVVVSSRDVAHARTLMGKRFEYIQWDGKTPAMLSPHLEDTDAVINLAGKNIAGGLWTDAFKKKLIDSRVVPGKALAGAFALCRNKPGTLVQTSATGFYGMETPVPTGETREAGEGFAAELCVQWENSVKEVEEMGTRLVYTRIGPVLGPHSPFLIRMLLPFRFGMGVILGDGLQWLSWIHILDVIQGIRFLIEHPTARGAFNFTSPSPVSMRQFVKAIGKIRKQPAWIHIPAFVLRLAMGRMAKETILASQDLLPEALQDAGYSFRYADLDSALSDLLKKNSPS